MLKLLANLFLFWGLGRHCSMKVMCYRQSFYFSNWQSLQLEKKAGAFGSEKKHQKTKPLETTNNQSITLKVPHPQELNSKLDLISPLIQSCLHKKHIPLVAYCITPPANKLEHNVNLLSGDNHGFSCFLKQLPINCSLQIKVGELVQIHHEG